MQIVFLIFAFLPFLNPLDLREIHHCLEHDLVEKKRVYFKVVQITLLVAVHCHVAHHLDRLIYLLHLP
jgi:hypothetical protein